MVLYEHEFTTALTVAKPLEVGRASQKLEYLFAKLRELFENKNKDGVHVVRILEILEASPIRIHNNNVGRVSIRWVARVRKLFPGDVLVTEVKEAIPGMVIVKTNERQMGIAEVNDDVSFLQKGWIVPIRILELSCPPGDHQFAEQFVGEVFVPSWEGLRIDGPGVADVLGKRDLLLQDLETLATSLPKSKMARNLGRKPRPPTGKRIDLRTVAAGDLPDEGWLQPLAGEPVAVLMREPPPKEQCTPSAPGTAAVVELLRRHVNYLRAIKGMIERLDKAGAKDQSMLWEYYKQATA